MENKDSLENNLARAQCLYKLGELYLSQKKSSLAKQKFIECAELVQKKKLISSKLGRSLGINSLNLAEKIIINSDKPTSTSNSAQTTSKEVEQGTENLTRKGGVEDDGKEEIKILYESSTINQIIFPPWSQVEDCQFQTTQTYLDMDGTLTLNEYQSQNFNRWIRLANLYKYKLKLFESLDGNQVVQKEVTNCSLVCSLIVLANYQTRFNKPVLTRLLYPQDEEGNPVVSKFNMYRCMLYVNGIFRKVEFDDLIPVDSTNSPMTATTKTHGEIWATLLEKAFMKLMGGYRFLGSNPCQDIHILSGWIPEPILFSATDSQNVANLWNRLAKGFNKGYVVATLGTGEDTRLRSKGLATGHAYAVLDVEEVEGWKLVKVKNPWGKGRWNGKFSPTDAKSWTSQLQQRLNYAPTNEAVADDGVFWITFADLVGNFEALYLNWNPSFFPFTFTLHNKWVVEGVQNDHTSFGSNPQYQFTITNPIERSPALTWILLTKHIHSSEEELDFIAIQLYKRTEQNKLQRIYTVEEPDVKGIYMNTYNLLLKFMAPVGVSNYTLIVSQRDHLKSMRYTIRWFCFAPFEVNELPMPNHRIELESSWGSINSGGSISWPSFFTNPQFQLGVPVPTTYNHLYGAHRFKAPATLTLTSKSERTLLGIVVLRDKPPITRLDRTKVMAQTLTYRSKFVDLQVDLEPGSYTVIPTTLDPNTLDSFTLAMVSDYSLKFKYELTEAALMRSRIFESKWERGATHPTLSQPSGSGQVVEKHFQLTVDKPTQIRLRLQLIQTIPIPIPIPIQLQVLDATTDELVVQSSQFTTATQGADATFFNRKTPTSSNFGTDYVTSKKNWLQQSRVYVVRCLAQVNRLDFPVALPFNLTVWFYQDVQVMEL